MPDPALTLVSGLVLEDGRRWGDAATVWQLDDAAAVLSGDGPSMHFLTRPRGASKTSDLAAVAIGAVVEQLPAGSRSYAVAADRDQGRLLLDALGGFVARTPGLDAVLRVDQWRVTNLDTGATLEALAADGASAYGLRPHLVIADELAQWPTTSSARTVWEAIVSAVPKVATGRLVVLTTAGDPAHWSHKVLVHARAQPRWRVAELPGPCPWIDPGALDEQRALLTESAFSRLHLNRWTSAEDRLTTVDALRACVTLDGPQEPRPGVHYRIGLDVGLVNDATVATVAHLDGPPGSGRVVLDRIAVWQGRRGTPVDLNVVEAWVRQASQTYNGAPVIFDPFQSVQLTQRLRAQGVVCREFTFSTASVGKLAMALYQLLRDGRLALPDDDELVDELANVRLVERTPGVFRLDHDPGRHDDRAIALALAAHALLATVSGIPSMVFDDGPGASLALDGSPLMEVFGPYAVPVGSLALPVAAAEPSGNSSPWSQI